MQQNATSTVTVAAVKPYKSVEFDAYITFLAVGGLVTDEDGKITRLTLLDFCERYNIDRTTTWHWKNETPNLAELVAKRREEIIPVSRASAVWNQLYLLAMQSTDKRAAVDAAKTWLGHYEGLRLPSQEVKHEVGNGLADLISAHRKQQIADNRKIIDADSSD